MAASFHRWGARLLTTILWVRLLDTWFLFILDSSIFAIMVCQQTKLLSEINCKIILVVFLLTWNLLNKIVESPKLWCHRNDIANEYTSSLIRRRNVSCSSMRILSSNTRPFSAVVITFCVLSLISLVQKINSWYLDHLVSYFSIKRRNYKNIFLF